MNKKKGLFLILAGLAVFSACKKDNAKSSQPTVQGKWSVVSIYHKDSSSSGTGWAYYPVTADDYIDFRADNKMYAYFAYQGGRKDTSAFSVTDKYILQTDTHVANGYDTLQLVTLTDTSLVLHNKTAYLDGYYENTWSLKK